MDNGELSSLDFRFLSAELGSRLKGGIFRKIYQFGRKQLAFEIFIRGSGRAGERVLYADSKRMFIAAERMEAPDEPPNFCMFLRKHLMGREIRDVRQHGFDRVIEIETDESILIFEFVPPGNIILCDKFYNIIMPLEIQRWKHREVKPKDSYLFPPGPHDITKIEIWDFFQEISKSEKDAVSALAGTGFGQNYALEICSRAGIKHDKPASKVTVDEATEIFNVFKAILNSKPEPCIYKDMVSAFPLKSRKAASKPAAGLSEALDVFFSKDIEMERHSIVQVAEEKAMEKEAGRVERIERARSEAKEVMAEKKAEKFTKAQLIYRNYAVVSNVLNGIKTARDGGFTWQQIRERLSSSSSPEAKAVREIRENEGIIVVNLEGSDTELDIRKTPEENAGKLFEGAKKLRKKLERMEKLPPPAPKPMDKIVEEVQATLAGGRKARARKPKAETAAEPKGEKASVAKRKAKKRWYETYRWFVSSEGNVVIAGKSALQNESVIKSRFKEGDFAFHADIHGAAFVVAKADKEGKVGLLTIKEAVEFAAAHSKAWAAGFGEVDVLQFKAGMLSKTSSEGAKLPKGSYYGRPSETHEKVEVKLSIGVQATETEAKVFAGPLMTVRKTCRYFATIQPGSMPAQELSQKVKNAILAKCMPEHRRAIEALPLDEFARYVPSGAGSLVG